MGDTTIDQLKGRKAVRGRYSLRFPLTLCGGVGAFHLSGDTVLITHRDTLAASYGMSEAVIQDPSNRQTPVVAALSIKTGRVAHADTMERAYAELVVGLARQIMAVAGRGEEAVASVLLRGTVSSFATRPRIHSRFAKVKSLELVEDKAIRQAIQRMRDELGLKVHAPPAGEPAGESAWAEDTMVGEEVNLLPVADEQSV